MAKKNKSPVDCDASKNQTGVSKIMIESIHMEEGQRFHGITRERLEGACDATPSRVVQFTAPTGTGKSYMVCNGQGSDRVLIVPSYTLTAQLGRKYGVPYVNGDVQELDFPSSGFGVIVSTYDGLRRVMSHIDPSTTYLYIDEVHQFKEAASYRMKTIDFALMNYMRFKGAVKMSATPKEGCPIPHTHEIKVTRDDAPVPVYLTECMDYIKIGKELFKQDDIEMVMISMNSRNKIAALAAVLVEMGETVGVITSETADTQEVKDILSGASKPKWIIGTNSMNDGIDIEPRRFSLIITSESRISTNSVQQVSSRCRNSDEMYRPMRVVVCRNSHDMSITPESQLPSLEGLVEDVSGYCEMLTAMHHYLFRIGELDQPINRAVNFQYNNMVHFEYDVDGNLVHIVPSASACMGEIERLTTLAMTTGDMLAGVEKYGFFLAGFTDYDQDIEGSFEEDVKEAKKSVTTAQKMGLEKFISDFMNMTQVSENMSKDMLNKRLDRATSRNYGKKEVETAKAIKKTVRAVTCIEGCDYRSVAHLMLETQSFDGKSVKELSKRAERHRVIYELRQGQGHNRDDVRFIGAVYDLFDEGDDFTGKEIEVLISQMGGDKHKMFIPKNRVSFMKQLFVVKRRMISRDGQAVNGYVILDKRLCQDIALSKS